MEFKRFKLTKCGMTAQNSVYKGYKTENGIHLEYYVSTKRWNYDASEYVENRNVIRAIDGDDALYREFCTLFSNCKINTWAGFHGSNPPDVLDGGSMSFYATLADGTEVVAGGTNNYPENFNVLSNAVHKLITTEKIKKVEFTDGTYEITLPESWVGIVSARFSEKFVSFVVDKTDGGDLTFFIIDNDTYGYSSDSYRGRVEVGRLVSGNDVRYITARDHDSVASYACKFSERVLALGENYRNDKNTVIESFRGVNGYDFYPEDGTILYYADAMDLADKARSLWLSLNFAGEYTGRAKPMRFKRRNYVPMFPPYDFTNTVESVRKKFLNVFSEKFTDEILKRAIEDKELIEHKGDVYVICKKCKGEASYNNRVDHVKDMGNGKFAVVMAVRMPPGGNTVYIDLPAEKNDAGNFVFTDYPYWDKSE